MRGGGERVHIFLTKTKKRGRGKNRGKYVTIGEKKERLTIFDENQKEKGIGR